MSNEDEDLARLYDKASQTKKAPFGKRIASFFIDFGFFLGAYCLIFFLAATPLIKEASKDSIASINETYSYHCDEHDYPYSANEANFGFFEMDDDAYVTALREKNPSLSENEAYDQYFTSYNSLITEVHADPKYVAAYGDFQKWYLFMDMLSYLIPLAIFELAIPLLNRERKTLSGFILHLSRVKTRDTRLANGYRLVIRFFVIFLFEFFLLTVFLNYWSLLLMPLGNMIMVLALPKRQTIGDLASGTMLLNSALVDRSVLPPPETRLDKENETAVATRKGKASGRHPHGKND